MKKYTSYIYTACLMISLVITAASCKKGYFYKGINDDPTQLKTPTPTLLLPGIIQSLGYEWNGDASRFPSVFMQQVTGTGNQSSLYQKYLVSSDDVDNMWTFGLYGGIMNNANSMITVADAAKQVHYSAIGKIMLADALGLTTDLWGDVPYTEAFKGVANLQPKFDPQAQIYTTIDGLLNDAITGLAATDATLPQPGDEDQLFHGDLEQWAKFAHSLRAKYYLHLAKIDASNYTKALTEAALGFSNDGENAAVPFSGSSVTSENPWEQEVTQRVGDYTFTGHVYDIMETAGDPRLAVYSDGDGGIGTLYGSPNSSVYLMSYDELMFIKAECEFQTGNKTAAAQAYNDAVAANLSRSVGGTAYAAKVIKTAANITLNDVMTQKYIANFLSPEVWIDWRRTGLPVLTPNPDGALAEIPRSLLYPSSEVRYNVNTPKNTSLTRRVYWDK